MLRTAMSMAGILEDPPESHSSVSHYPFDLSHHPGAPLGGTSQSQENVMAPDQVVLDAELKGLKAAFKQAIGGGKKKKAKGRKKKADSFEGIPEEQPAAAQSDAVESDLPLPRQDPNNHVFNSQNRDKITADAIDNSHSVISRNSLIMTSWNGNANGLQYSPGKTFGKSSELLFSLSASCSTIVLWSQPNPNSVPVVFVKSSLSTDGFSYEYVFQCKG